jgi:hypothetical protein
MTGLGLAISDSRVGPGDDDERDGSRKKAGVIGQSLAETIAGPRISARRLRFLRAATRCAARRASYISSCQPSDG